MPLFSIVFSMGGIWSQKTYNIVDFKDQHVLYTDIGISPAPFNLYYPFTSEIRSLKYKNNFNIALAIILLFNTCFLKSNFFSLTFFLSYTYIQIDYS